MTRSAGAAGRTASADESPSVRKACDRHLVTASGKSNPRSGAAGRRGRSAPDFARLLRQWDSIFLSTVDPTRDDRVRAILRALDGRLDGPARVIDLGTGPGALASRVAERFPRCRVLGLDTDPVLLAVGERALARYGRRTTWLLTDLRGKGWSSPLPAGCVDAAVSSLALNWLGEAEIITVYRELRRLIRPGGVFVNGDFLPSDRIVSAASREGSPGMRERRSETVASRVQKFKPKWERWWRTLENVPSLYEAFRQRQTRLPGPIPPQRTSGPRVAVRLEFHERALRTTGFCDTAVVWRTRDFRVLIGVK